MIDNQKQLVSIGLLTFNRAPTLTRAVDSLLAQTYENFELIISDNASTDNTSKICAEYAKKDNRVQYFRQDKNIGMAGNFEFIFNKASGPYFMMASDDDWWHPDFIFKLKEALDKHPEYGVAMSSLRQVHEDGSLFNEIIYEGRNDVTKLSPSRVFNAVIFKNPPTHFFIMGLFRTEILKKLFWKPNENIFGGDKILMYETSLITHFYSVQDILWIRTSSLIPDAKRYKGDYLEAFTDRWAHFKHLRSAISRLAMSPNISLRKKTVLLPAKIPVLVWGFRKHLVRELFPHLFQTYVKYRKMTNRNG